MVVAPLGIDVVKVFSDRPLSLSELTRIASDKIKASHNTKTYINILEAYYFEHYKVYAVLFELPVFVNAASEGGGKKHE